MRKLWGISAAAAVLVGFACSDFEAGDGSPVPDAAIADDGGMALADGSIAPPIEASVQKCTDKPFGVPTLVDGLLGARGFSLSPDETTAFFTLDGKLWTAPWSFATGLGQRLAVPSAGSVGSVFSLTADAKVVFYEDFFRLFRQEGSPSKYASPVEVRPAPDVPDGRFLANPFIDRTTNELYLSVHKLNDFFTPPYGIVRTVIEADGTWSKFAIVNVDGDSTALGPVLSADGLSLYYASMKDTPPTKNGEGTDIWVARRDSPLESGFRDGQRLATVSDPASGDVPAYVSRDGCTLFLRSTRGTPPDAGATFSVYRATRE